MLRRVISAALTLGVATIGVGAVTSSPARATGPTVHAGLTSDDAGPSCWAIKQSFPSSNDGIYWLNTAALIAPQQFYCDMTTDGGGWVLVGRGRNGWRFHNVGQSSAANLRNFVNGPSAFWPAVLADKVVDGLLGGQRPDALNDGIRLVRATNTSGTSWQEGRWYVASTKTWSWAFSGGEPMTTMVYGSSSYTDGHNGLSTANSGFDNGYLRATLDVNHKQTKGFAYGTWVSGSSSSTSYLYPGISGSGAVPFTQVWIRPRVDDATSGFTTVSDSGTPESTLSWLPKSDPQTFTWGVVDPQKVADPDSHNDAPAQALQQVGNTMFVGGKFANVQNGAGGAKYNQPWLAGFDVQTGVWIPSFHPQLDGTVFSLAASPDGNLIVAGNFTNINGAPNTSGLAELDPITGEVVSSFNAHVTNPRFGAARAHVRKVYVHDNWLYVVGGFNRIVGGPTSKTVYALGVGRVSLTDGTPDYKWKATVDLTPIDVFASDDGNRVYIAGFFHNVNNTPGIDAVAVLDTTTGALVPGMNRPQFDQGNSRYWYQYAAFEYNGNIYQGGSQHDLQEYSYNDYSLLASHITQWGGDFQTARAYHGVVFGGCHCYFYDYANTDTWPTPTNFDRVESSNWFNAYDANGLVKETDFDPVWAMASSGEGTWGQTIDNYDCVWAAGDMNRGALHNGVYDWLGGFARFCPRDTTAPGVPTNLKASGGQLLWTSSTDDSGVAPTYEVLRDDRVVISTTSRKITVPGPGRYFVRAIDATGNRSASTSVIVL